MNWNRIVKWLVVIVAVSTSGCAHIKMYPGEKLPPEKVSVVDVSYFKCTSVDGKMMPFAYNLFADNAQLHDREISLLPGKHTLSGLCYERFSGGYRKTKKPQDVRFLARAGRKYKVEHYSYSVKDDKIIVKDGLFSLHGNRMIPYVVDDKSGKRVPDLNPDKEMLLKLIEMQMLIEKVQDGSSKKEVIEIDGVKLILTP